jgi:hypothetical protein
LKISYELKRKCAEMANNGMTYREIYNSVFLPSHKGMSLNTFKRKLQDWRKKKWTDDKALEAANLDWQFTPYAATVQVNGNGEVVQSWVKQSAGAQEYERLIETIKENVEPVRIECTRTEEASHMLEIPLWDTHLGIADAEWYSQTVEETIWHIQSRHWKKILIPIGQDLFHNDDFRGGTSSGKQIEKVDMVKAWEDAKTIFYSLIEEAQRNADEVEIVYIRGNHDESMTWAFTQLLKERYGNTDDSLDYKKVRTFGRCFIGLTHGNGKKSNARDLRGQFTVRFPVQFASSDVREIHAGHIHHEKEVDEYGVMVRRLCTGNKQDEWSDSEGFEGALKRFMLFDWSETKLSGIYYV